MITFDPQNPFPLLPIGSYNYAEAKAHAVQVDQWLGFNLSSIENGLESATRPSSDFPQERWIGLDAQSFLTPYVELRSMLELLNPQAGECMIDLGCGYGRMGHIVGRHYPWASFLGYELVPERVREAQKILSRYAYPTVHIEQKDLVAEAPPKAAYYFIYDYGSKAAIQKTLEDLKEISKHQTIQVVARGRASRFFIQEDHAWLSQVHDPRHFETFSIYQS